jgi:hypothetical protein
VTIQDDPDGIDTIEMEKLEVENAISYRHARARAQIPITKDW